MVLRSDAEAGRPSAGGSCTMLSAIERHGMPCSASKGVILVSASCVQFHTWAMIGMYKWNCAYCSVGMALSALPHLSGRIVRRRIFFPRLQVFWVSLRKQNGCDRYWFLNWFLDSYGDCMCDRVGKVRVKVPE